MAELTHLEEKLGEVIGLAQAAQTATEKIIKLEEAEQAKDVFERMNEEAAETEKRGTTIVESIEGKKTAILEKASRDEVEGVGHAQDVHRRRVRRIRWVRVPDDGRGRRSGPLEGARNDGQERPGQRPRSSTLRSGPLPIQERHFSEAQGNSLKLAADQDPNETS